MGDDSFHISLYLIANRTVIEFHPIFYLYCSLLLFALSFQVYRPMYHHPSHASMIMRILLFCADFVVNVFHKIKLNFFVTVHMCGAVPHRHSGARRIRVIY